MLVYVRLDNSSESFWVDWSCYLRVDQGAPKCTLRTTVSHEKRSHLTKIMACILPFHSFLNRFHTSPKSMQQQPSVAKRRHYFRVEFTNDRVFFVITLSHYVRVWVVGAFHFEDWKLCLETLKCNTMETVRQAHIPNHFEAGWRGLTNREREWECILKAQVHRRRWLAPL